MKWLPGERRLFILMFIIMIFGACTVLTGCNISDNKSKWFPWTVPDEGRVNGKSYTPEDWVWQPGTTTCSGSPSVCTTTPGYMQYYPEHWDLDLYAPDGDHGWKRVDESEFEACQVDDYYPDCTR